MNTDVIVAGAGPTGLLLAGELALGGARVVVLERLAARTGQSKALNLQPRSAEVLAARGLLDDLLALAPARLPAGHFAGIPLDYSPLRTPVPVPDRHSAGPRRRTPGGLGALAGRRDPLRRAVESSSQDEAGVTVNGARAGYLVGCDGGRSPVRKRLGVAVPRTGRADVRAGRRRHAGRRRPDRVGPARAEGRRAAHRAAAGRRRLPGAGRRPGPAGGRPGRPGARPPRSPQALPADGLTLGEVRWASRFTDATRQAAHTAPAASSWPATPRTSTRPAGGQGLNLGLQDAFNLGWKLAEVIRGESGDDLLDTYHAERHPVAARVLQSTRAQGVLFVPDEDVTALREVFTDWSTPGRWPTRVAGLDHGLRLPDLDLRLLHDGRRHVVDTPTGPVAVRPDGFRASARPCPADHREPRRSPGVVWWWPGIAGIPVLYLGDPGTPPGGGWARAGRDDRQDRA